MSFMRGENRLFEEMLKKGDRAVSLKYGYSNVRKCLRKW